MPDIINPYAGTLKGSLSPDAGLLSGIAQGATSFLESLREGRRDALDKQQQDIQNKTNQSLLNLKFQDQGLLPNQGYDSTKPTSADNRPFNYDPQYMERRKQLQDFERNQQEFTTLLAGRAGMVKEGMAPPANYNQLVTGHPDDSIVGTNPIQAPQAVPPQSAPQNSAPAPSSQSQGPVQQAGGIPGIPLSPSIRKARAEATKSENDAAASNPNTQMDTEQAKSLLTDLDKKRQEVGLLSASLKSLNDPNASVGVKADSARGALKALNDGTQPGRQAYEDATEYLNPSLENITTLFGKKLPILKPDFDTQAKINQNKLNDLQDQIAKEKDLVQKLRPGYKFKDDTGASPGQDTQIASYAKTHGIGYSQAQTILNGRGYGR